MRGQCSNGTARAFATALVLVHVGPRIAMCLCSFIVLSLFNFMFFVLMPDPRSTGVCFLEHSRSYWGGLSDHFGVSGDKPRLAPYKVHSPTSYCDFSLVVHVLLLVPVSF